MKFAPGKKWAFFGLFAVTTGLISLIVLRYAPAYKDLLWLYIYSIPSHVYISLLPHEPVLLYVSQSHNVILVVLAAGAGTLAAGLIDYETLSPTLKHRAIRSLYHDKQFYRKSVRLFYKAPFWVIVVTAFAPIPYYPFKLLSIASGYPEDKYLSALLVGRVPRYLLLALAGTTFHIPKGALLALFIGMFVLAGGQRAAGILKKAVRKMKKRSNAAHNEL